MNLSRWMTMALSLVVALWLPGCTDAKKGDFKNAKEASKGKPEEHKHEHEEPGPHGGHLVELGDHEYHGEVCFEAKDKKLTVYILGHELTQPQPIEEKEVTLSLMIDGKATPFQLKAAPLEGEKEGQSSRFELAGDLTVADHIKDEEDLNGNLSVTIKGKPYSGKIEHGHDHDHDHGHGAAAEKKDADHKHDEKEKAADEKK